MTDKVMLPKIVEYGRSGDANTLYLNFPRFTIWYSYETIVAFRDTDVGLVCSENIWSNTTSKHLNLIQKDKSKRYKSEKFNIMLHEFLTRHVSR